MKHGYYVEVEPIILKFLAEKNCHFYYFCGGRGTGKTYGALDMCRKIGAGELHLDVDGVKEKFLYLRMTDTQAKICSRREASPFKAYNRGEGYTITVDYESSFKIGNVYMDEAQTDHIGYIAGLSTFANLRGVDFSDVTFVLFDECLPEKGQRYNVKQPADLLMNALETINRNRALEGRNEVVLCMLSNPIDLGDDLLSGLGFVEILNNMTFRGQQRYTDENRSLHIERYVDHKVSTAKLESSVLYKFANDLQASRALSGDFIDNDLSMVIKPNLKEYNCYIKLAGVLIYRHKVETKFHVTFGDAPAQYEFTMTERDKVKEFFGHTYKRLVVNNLITYSTYAAKVAFEQMICYKPLY